MMKKIKLFFIPLLGSASMVISSLLPLGENTFSISDSLRNESSLTIEAKGKKSSDGGLLLNMPIANFFEKYNENISNIDVGHDAVSFIQTDNESFPYLLKINDFNPIDEDKSLELRAYSFDKKVVALSEDGNNKEYITLLPNIPTADWIGDRKNAYVIERFFDNTIRTFSELIELYSNLTIKNKEQYFKIENDVIYLNVFDPNSKVVNPNLRVVITERKEDSGFFLAEVRHESIN